MNAAPGYKYLRFRNYGLRLLIKLIKTNRKSKIVVRTYFILFFSLEDGNHCVEAV